MNDETLAQMHVSCAKKSPLTNNCQKVTGYCCRYATKMLLNRGFCGQAGQIITRYAPLQQVDSHILPGDDRAGPGFARLDFQGFHKGIIMGGIVMENCQHANIGGTA